MTRSTGQHSSKTPEWGTPRPFVFIARKTLGRIDVDPASSPHWNGLVQAQRIITKREDGRKTPWVPGAPAPGGLSARRRTSTSKRFTALVNPPGERTGELVADYWRALAAYFELGWITSAVWIGFSVEQLARLQRVDAASHPLEHVTLIPARREPYRPRHGNKAQPSHASFLTLCTRSASEVARFTDLGGEIGHVIRGVRWR